MLVKWILRVKQQFQGQGSCFLVHSNAPACSAMIGQHFLAWQLLSCTQQCTCLFCHDRAALLGNCGAVQTPPILLFLNSFQMILLFPKLKTVFNRRMFQDIKENLFFFFRWRYSPLWALACRTIPLHFSLSITNSLHLLTPNT